ncbi:hypothetical protein LVJ94_41165 [Pendulispora rubella]|uniref:Uncharacterized protein n=1 Tax=Pendulispora rubella TaxID=2741070 RepID=A0ABZ2L0F2_9BACT
MTNILTAAKERLDVLFGAAPAAPNAATAPGGIALGLLWAFLFGLIYLFGGSNAKFIYIDF